MSDEFKKDLEQMTPLEFIALAMGQGPADLRDPLPPEEDEEQHEQVSDD